MTELVKVSLLTEPSSDGTRLLNNVTKACALLVPTKISSEEMVAFEDNAKEVWNYWDQDDTSLLNELDISVLEPDTRNGKNPSMEIYGMAPHRQFRSRSRRNNTPDQKPGLPGETNDDSDDEIFLAKMARTKFSISEDESGVQNRSTLTPATKNTALNDELIHKPEDQSEHLSG